MTPSGPQAPGGVGLRRTLGVGDAIVIGLGSMVGAGIFAALAWLASLAVALTPARSRRAVAVRLMAVLGALLVTVPLGDLASTLWSVHVGEPVLFQPAVARGRVYATTQGGNLFCLETGDPDDDGWLMWGAGPHHNGLHG